MKWNEVVMGSNLLVLIIGVFIGLLMPRNIINDTVMAYLMIAVAMAGVIFMVKGLGK